RIRTTKNQILHFVRMTTLDVPSLLLDSGLGAARFGALANAFIDVRPASDHAFPVLLLNEAEAGVAELDDGHAIFFAEAVLDVVGDGIGHHQRAREFEERGPLDGLNVSPEMAIAFAQIAVPAATGPRLEHHGHGSAVRLFAVR